jgi:ParB-like chromosome segregation protein Spo0J
MSGKLRGKANGSISVPKIERVKISILNRADYNPRKISGKARSGLSKSLEKFGIMNLIIWNRKTGNVVGGHQRLDIIEARGETETDVVVVNLEPKDEVALNIALNNQALAGDYEASALDQLLAIKDVVGDDFEGLCFDELEKELEKVAKRAKKDDLPVIEEPPPLPEVSGLPEIDVTQIESVACIRCPKCKKEWRMDKIVQS